MSELLCHHVIFNEWRQDPRPIILVSSSLVVKIDIDV